MTRIQIQYGSSNNTIVDDAILWCVDKFGKLPGKWNYLGHGEFVFKREEDAVFFALRWV